MTQRQIRWFANSDLIDKLRVVVFPSIPRMVKESDLYGI